MRKTSLKTFGVLVVLCQINVFAHAYEPKAKKTMATEGKRDNSDKKLEGDGKTSTAVKNTYDYHLAGPDGKDIPLADFKDKVILVVNLARNSSYHSQLPALIKLSEIYKDKGLVVIGVPSNDFGGEEPGTDAEIQQIYKSDDKVPFPVMARSTLVGEEEIPFYQYLTKGKGALPGGDVHWNYTKFLIDRHGKVIVRFSQDVAPDSAEMLATLDEIFAGTYNPKKKEQTGQSASDEDDGRI